MAFLPLHVSCRCETVSPGHNLQSKAKTSGMFDARVQGFLRNRCSRSLRTLLRPYWHPSKSDADMPIFSSKVLTLYFAQYEQLLGHSNIVGILSDTLSLSRSKFRHNLRNNVQCFFNLFEHSGRLLLIPTLNKHPPVHGKDTKMATF